MNSIFLTFRLLCSTSSQLIAVFAFVSTVLLLFSFSKSLLDLKVRDEGCSDHGALKKLCESVIKYSLKTGHANFHNQLFGGVDPFGLAGSWITDALNTSQ